MPTQTEEARTSLTHENSSPANPAPTLQPLVDDQASYTALRYRASLGVLVVAPALVILPPRKMDLFTFGLGASWLYCLGEVANQHGRDPWRGFKRYEQFEKEKLEGRDMGGRVAETNGELVGAGGWRGEKVVRDVRPKEAGRSISEIIIERVWDVWEQKDRDQEEGKKGKN